nr:EOG090X0HLW [Chydorus sphaericus]
MRFRFCGDQDCPDWFLTQMATLSRLSSVKAKLLAQHVGRHLSGQQEIELTKMESLLADSKLLEKEVRSLLASLEFVLSSASRFQTSEETLRAELQQLGLPKEHAAALGRVQLDYGPAIRQSRIRNSLMINRLDDVKIENNGVGSSIQLDFNIDGGKNLKITADPAKLQTLLYEMEKVESFLDRNGLFL